MPLEEGKRHASAAGRGINGLGGPLSIPSWQRRQWASDVTEARAAGPARGPVSGATG